MPTAPSVRLAGDRCPGVLRLIEAADGLLARVRLPGGLVAADALRALAGAADELGDGRLELTSRGNVQVRGMTPSEAEALVDRVAAAGLLPTPARDRVRNILASPLAGIDNDLDLTAIVGDLDVALRNEPGLGELSGRFLFGIDDGRGDIAALRPDLLAVLRDGRAWVEGAECRPPDVAAVLVDGARAFLEVRAEAGSSAWRIEDLPEGRALTRSRLRADPPIAPESIPSAAPTPPVGRVARADGGTALVAVPPLGRLTSSQARWLAGHAGAHALRITPWRSVVLPQAPVDDPTATGLVVAADSPWRSVSACAGRPRCSQALADVQADATAALGQYPGRRVHWAGCDRCCGRTADVEVTMIATPAGYRVEDRVA